MPGVLGRDPPPDTRHELAGEPEQVVTWIERIHRQCLRAAVSLAVAIAAGIGLPAAPAMAAPTGTPTDQDAATSETGAADALRDRYAALRPQLEQNPFQRPLYLESAAGPHSAQGDVFALVDHPLANITGSLTNPDNWCDVLLLHPNVKFCRTDSHGERAVLRVAMATKRDQTLENAHTVEFNCNVAVPLADYTEAELLAAHGPFGTRDYRIALQAVALENGQTFLHLKYSFGYGFQARVAMGLYLATAGSDKVGFTMVTSNADRPPQPVRGIRGAVERNVMRYFLAVEAHVATLAAPEPERFERSLEHWFDATEAYATPLHEMNRDAYLSMKRKEHQRQQALNQAITP
jgi:hypothetical protein